MLRGRHTTFDIAPPPPVPTLMSCNIFKRLGMAWAYGSGHKRSQLKIALSVQHVNHFGVHITILL